MLSKRYAAENKGGHMKCEIIQDRWATRSLEGTEQEQQFRVSTRSLVVCDLQREVQRDIKKLLEV